MKKNDLFHLPQYTSYFNNQYIRGPKQGAPYACNLFLTPSPNKSPPVPPLSIKGRIMDLWCYSKPFKLLQKLLLLR